MNDSATGLALLRKAFPANQISKLPKPYKKDSPKGKCGECGGYHGLPAVHLDYVGHAALTDRLLEADPMWTWEPVADAAALGLPTASGGMWIRLTVCGVTRYGFGFADGKSGGDAVKETIGDALRNAAMRFGAALDLWHKGQLHEDDESAQPEPVEIVAPDGYEEWRNDFISAADNGSAAVSAAWKGARVEHRRHFDATTTDEQRAALRKRTQAADAQARQGEAVPA